MSSILLNYHTAPGPHVSFAAAPLGLAAGHGVEFFIVCLFVLMILLTFGPLLMLTALELLQIVVHRHDPEHGQRVRLAERLLARPDGRRRLTRFTPHQRVQHWFLFVIFTMLALTGFSMQFANTAWAQRVIGVFGGLSRTRTIHHGAGILLLAGFAYHLIYLAVCVLRQRTGRGLVRTILDSPMIITYQDWKHLVHLAGYLLFLRPTRPKGGRFSPEEKFEYFGVFWGVILLGVTGILLMAHGWMNGLASGRLLRLALLVHSLEAFLALLHVGILHMVGVVFSPTVFPFSPAMITGNTPVEELAEGHAALLEAAAAEDRYD